MGIPGAEQVNIAVGPPQIPAPQPTSPLTAACDPCSHCYVLLWHELPGQQQQASGHLLQKAHRSLVLLRLLVLISSADLQISLQHLRQAACICRMLWSFSRDGGMPFSFLWSKVNKFFGIPVNAVSSLACLGLSPGHDAADELYSL